MGGAETAASSGHYTQLRSSHVFETQLQYSPRPVYCNKFLPSSHTRDEDARMYRIDYAKMAKNNYRGSLPGAMELFFEHMAKLSEKHEK